MTRKIVTLAVGLVILSLGILLSLGGIGRAADFIGCIGEYRAAADGWTGRCAGVLRTLHLLPKPAYWRDCDFARAKPIFSDIDAAHDFCASKHMVVVGVVQRLYNGGGGACGYIIDHVKCVPSASSPFTLHK
jgi:hypothetical protein